MAAWLATGGVGGQEEPSEADRPERLARQADHGRAYGDIDPDKISDEALLSFFGYKNWDEWRRAQSDDPLELDEYEPPEVRDEEPERADQAAETDQPEQIRLWRTIAEEAGEVTAYPSYTAARRDLGSVPGTELHHIVERASRGTSSTTTARAYWTGSWRSGAGTMTRDLEQDREAFRRYVTESDRLAEMGDADAANAETERLEQLAEMWQADGRAVEFLSPLLADTETRAVRFNAASWLLHKGHPEPAIPVLEAIRRGSGVEALHAGLLLDDWRQHQS